MKHYEVFVNDTFHGEYVASNAYFARMKCAHDYGFSLSLFDKIHADHGSIVVVSLKV
jgi:hypothetical protein